MVPKVFVRSAYNYDVDAASDEAGLACSDVSRAQQHFRDECDINTIVRRFGLSGELPTNVRMPQYGDFTGITDFHSAMNAVAMANESFDAMPAEVRARFQNDPGKFVEFCMDPGNLEEAKKLGLVEATKAAAALAAGAVGSSTTTATASSVAAPAASTAPVGGTGGSTGTT